MLPTILSVFKRACQGLTASMLISVFCLTAGQAFADTRIAPAQRQGSDFSTLLPSSATRLVQPNAASAATHLPLKAAQTFLSNVTQHTSDVVVEALLLIGVRYQWGGNTPKSGMDCSGFVKYVFQDTLGLTLPRRAIDMSRVGRKVSQNNLQPGDLVFFNTIRRTVSHVGIYIGDNKFVHSPATGKTIRIDRLANTYWKARYTGARRIIMAAQ